MISLVALIILTYVAFVFFSECPNPFAKPKLHWRRPLWRYGRRMALAVFYGGVCSLILLHETNLDLVIAVGIGATLTLMVGLCISAKRIGDLFRC